MWVIIILPMTLKDSLKLLYRLSQAEAGMHMCSKHSTAGGVN